MRVHHNIDLYRRAIGGDSRLSSETSFKGLFKEQNITLMQKGQMTLARPEGSFIKCAFEIRGLPKMTHDTN